MSFVVNTHGLWEDNVMSSRICPVTCPFEAPGSMGHGVTYERYTAERALWLEQQRRDCIPHSCAARGCERAAARVAETGAATGNASYPSSNVGPGLTQVWKSVGPCFAAHLGRTPDLEGKPADMPAPPLSYFPSSHAVLVHWRALHAIMNVYHGHGFVLKMNSSLQVHLQSSTECHII
jgi:hypothetical protein